MRALPVLALLTLLTAAMVPAVADDLPDVPGLIPTATGVVETVQDEVEGSPVAPTVDAVGGAVIDAFHDLATKPQQVPMDEPGAINDGAWETTRAAMDWDLQILGKGGGQPHYGGTRPNFTYTLTAAGTYSYHGPGGADYAADAECTLLVPQGGTTWQPHRFTSGGADGMDIVLEEAPGTPDARKVFLDWVPVDPWPAASGHSADCSSTHTYTATFTATKGWGRLFANDGANGDNTGAVRVQVGGPPPQYPAWWQCPKFAIDRWSPQAYWRGELQTATVIVDSRRNANQFPTPSQWAPHLNFWNESGHNGIYTCNHLVPWGKYDLTVSGTFTYAQDNPLNHPMRFPGWVVRELDGMSRQLDQQHNLGTTFDAPLADAECKQGLADDEWMSHREDHVVNNFNGQVQLGTDYIDLTLNELWVKWFPASDATAQCDPDHNYVIRGWSPNRITPLHLWIKDERYAEHDNFGHLVVTIVRTA